MASSHRGLPDVPLHGKLSAQYKTTFAYPTIKDRCPIILCKIIDHLYRERINIGTEFGTEAQESLKNIIEQLSKLRYEMQTNKPISKLSDGGENCNVWNAYLDKAQENGEGVTWYSATWMWVECYMYRRILSSFLDTQQLQKFDFFRHQKEEGFRESLASMSELGSWLQDQLEGAQQHSSTQMETNFKTLIRISLWGNKCDLSISAGSKQSATGNIVEQLHQLETKILADSSHRAWECVQAGGCNQILDVVMDNAGFELFTDLCLADYLVTSNLVKKVRFRLKNQPWFVSDTNPHDFHWCLDTLSNNETDNTLKNLGTRWKNYVDSECWEVHVDPFWTYPHVFSEMEACDPQLYSTLAQANLVVFKGDLNYRKLVGDINWETTIPFKKALQGFQPSNILSLRTLKADVVAGLAEGQAETANSTDKQWMINGNWGVIQYAGLL
eukprot:TRINITY_DN4384_c0_g1_i1.p1 TRINITY_DN4384_c0_g1~~TRINITY_DN4384_c0_g1_i1.p1  ORF type:complete len:442 (-),score=79.47 TRINITY_DN4384_c0_g1_i1:201-1526(-)